MRPRALFLGAGTMLVACFASRADDKKPGPPPAVALTLAAVESKTDKKLVFRCVLKNASDKPIEVADGYDGKTVSLLGKGEGQRRELRLYPRVSKKIGSVTVKAGEERVVFELPTDDIVFDQITGNVEEGKQSWRWDWTARPASPPTPFHQSGRVSRLVRRAEFWAEVEVDGQRTTTKTVSLELRLGVLPVGESK